MFSINKASWSRCLCRSLHAPSLNRGTTRVWLHVCAESQGITAAKSIWADKWSSNLQRGGDLWVKVHATEDWSFVLSGMRWFLLTTITKLNCSLWLIVHIGAYYLQISVSTNPALRWRLRHSLAMVHYSRCKRGENGKKSISMLASEKPKMNGLADEAEVTHKRKCLVLLWVIWRSCPCLPNTINFA